MLTPARSGGRLGAVREHSVVVCGEKCGCPGAADAGSSSGRTVGKMKFEHEKVCRASELGVVCIQTGQLQRSEVAIGLGWR